MQELPLFLLFFDVFAIGLLLLLLLLLLLESDALLRLERDFEMPTALLPATT
jgi:hypothetical protein